MKNYNQFDDIQKRIREEFYDPELRDYIAKETPFHLQRQSGLKTKIEGCDGTPLLQCESEEIAEMVLDALNVKFFSGFKISGIERRLSKEMNQE